MVKVFRPEIGPNPLGVAIGNLGKTMFEDQLGAAIKNEQLYNLQRGNVETDNLMRSIAERGAQDITADPRAQAMLLGSTYDPGKFGEIALLGGATKYGAQDPRTQNLQVGTGQSYDNTYDAFSTKAAEVARANSLASADRRYAVDQNTGVERYKWDNLSADQAADNSEAFRNNNLQSADRRYGVDQSQGTERYKFDNTPKEALIDGKPGFAPQGQLAAMPGAAPIMSETDVKGTRLNEAWPTLSPAQQQRAMGLTETRTAKAYIIPGQAPIPTFDGITNAQTGAPLPVGGAVIDLQDTAAGAGLTNSTQSGVQQAILANNKLSRLIDEARSLAMKDPTNFGITGSVKGFSQDTTQLAQTLAHGFGYKGAEEFIADAQRRAADSGVDPSLLSGIYDPNLASLHTVSDLMVYSAAEALAGQEGRNVSDRDVQFFRGIVGDPTNWLMNQEKYLSKLTQIERILQLNQQENNAAQGQGAIDRTGMPAAPQVGGTNTSSTGAKWRVLP